MDKNNKLIIHNYTNLSDYEALEYIQLVVGKGKVSDSKYGKQYCYVTTFKNGITVQCTRRNDTYTFYLIKEGV